MKYFLSLLLAGFLFLSPAKADECQIPFTSVVAAVTANPENTIQPITATERAALLEKKGPPPIDEPYEISIIRTEDVGIILITKDECVVARIGPVPLQLLETFRGNRPA